MAFHPQFQPLSSDQGFFGGLKSGQDFVQNLLKFPQEQQQRQIANALNEYKRQYEQQRSKNYPSLIQSELELAQLAPQEKQQLMSSRAQEMKYNPQRWEAQMNEQNAHTENYKTESDINRFKLQNPTYINPDAALISEVIRNQAKTGVTSSDQAQTYTSTINKADQHSQSTDEKINPAAYSFNPGTYQSPTGDPTLDTLFNKRFGMNPIAEQ